MLADVFLAVEKLAPEDRMPQARKQAMIRSEIPDDAL